MLGLLQHRVDAHAAEIGIGGAGFETGIEYCHLVAGEGGNGVDAEIAVAKRLRQRPCIGHVQRQGAHALGIVFGNDFVDAVAQQVGDDQQIVAVGLRLQQVAHNAGARRTGAAEDEDSLVRRVHAKNALTGSRIVGILIRVGIVGIGPSLAGKRSGKTHGEAKTSATINIRQCGISMSPRLKSPGMPIDYNRFGLTIV